MNDFWNNVSRYPRFFISSVAGLILIIIAPFRNLMKVKRLRIFVPVIIITMLVGLYFILVSMTGA